MDHDGLKSILDELSYLLIHASELTVEDNELGAGGFGDVFLGVLRSSASQTRVAVKQLRMVQTKSFRHRAAIRLARELKVWASAIHPNILKLVGFHLSNDYGCAQLVSEYMANGNVKEYINRQKPNLDARLRFVQGITSGMRYLHNCSPPICHGDLKPANVLVNEIPDAVLCDFGLATFIEGSEGPSGLTTSKFLNGSTRYMAPELLGAEAKHTPESDVWAWACTIFEVLTDCMPFHDMKADGPVLLALFGGRHPGSVDLLDRLVSGGQITSHPTLLALKSIIADCWIMDSAKRPSSSNILDRLILPDRSEALGHDILQPTLDDLSYLLIDPSHLTVEDNVELGVGGFGEVFLAVLRSSDSQIKVTVKELRIVQAQGFRGSVAIRLARDLKVWATAKHPNILELLGFYLSDDCWCAQLVSGYMTNGNVKEYINRQKPNLDTRLRFVRGITSGMSYLHNCSPPICHGDLKPANVLVNENPDAVLCDFGLATFVEESEGPSGLTTSKFLNGSTRYMAPELLEGEAKHTLESDVWAWACTIFEVLTDCVPFHDLNKDRAILVALFRGRHPGSVDLLDSLVSGGQITSHPTLLALKSIIADCWIIDSAKRPSSSNILNRLILPDRFKALGHDILQSTLDHLSYLLIHPSQLTLECDVELGVGSFGEVFLAVLRSSDSQTKVAVKQLRIVQARDVHRFTDAYWSNKRLARELKVWATAKHPNILKLVGFYLSDNYRCAQLVSEYMANGNVKEYINRQKPNLDTRLRFVQGITSGMSYLHNCNPPPICHGNLKPTNVLVNENLDTVLCNFGFATFIEEPGVSSGLTTSKSLKGSIRYMAPELLEGEAKHTLESDVWAWACTIFEVLTDCMPFHDIKGDGAVLATLFQGRHPGSVDLLDSLVSGGQITSHPTLLALKSIIADCWIIDSAKRPSSSNILNRLILPDRFEALDIATASARIPGTSAEDALHPPSPLLDVHEGTATND